MLWLAMTSFVGLVGWVSRTPFHPAIEACHCQLFTTFDAWVMMVWYDKAFLYYLVHVNIASFVGHPNAMHFPRLLPRFVASPGCWIHGAPKTLPPQMHVMFHLWIKSLNTRTQSEKGLLQYWHLQFLPGIPRGFPVDSQRIPRKF